MSLYHPCLVFPSSSFLKQSAFNGQEKGDEEENLRAKIYFMQDQKLFLLSRASNTILQGLNPYRPHKQTAAILLRSQEQALVSTYNEESIP